MSSAEDQIRAIGQMIRGCLRKTAYGSLRNAEREVRRQKSNRDRDMRTYHCQLCGKWHLTRVRPDVSVNTIRQAETGNPASLKAENVF